MALKEQGVNVRAAVLQEEIERPTPGRSVLLSAGIPVLALAPAGRIDPMHAIGPLLASIDRSPPSAVLLWNVIPEYKVLLADTLIGLDLYDVSPGEMNFSSLDRYFKRPRPGLPYLTSQEYGRRLTGAIVKYGGEAALARDVLQTTIHVIPNGVPVPQKRIQRASSQLLSIGTAARINPQKRLEDLLAAIRIAHTRLPPYEVLIAGGVEIGCESYAEELRAMSVGLPIRWIGEFSDTAGFYQSLDLFAMISEPAGCPNASLEAMAAGLPIIATDVGGASEQVEEGINGKLVPARDANAFAEALVFMATHPELRLQMGNESHLLANSKFSIERMVRDYRLALGL